jgi:uncharacterized OsmC-like protein
LAGSLVLAAIAGASSINAQRQAGEAQKQTEQAKTETAGAKQKQGELAAQSELLNKSLQATKEKEKAA